MIQHRGHWFQLLPLFPTLSFRLNVGSPTPHHRLFVELTGLVLSEKVEISDGEILVGYWWLSSAGLLTHVHPLYLSLCPARCPSVTPGHHLLPSGPWRPPPVCCVHCLRPLKETWGSKEQQWRWKCLYPLASLCKGAFMLGVIKQPSSAPRSPLPPPPPPLLRASPGRCTLGQCLLFYWNPSLAEDLLPVYSSPSFLCHHAYALLFLITF